MFENTHSRRRRLWEKFKDPSYRHEFIASNLSTGIAAQLLTMRLCRDWTQKQVAERAGMADARISVMENPSYDKFTLTTLKRLARAFDVGLIVRFVSFSEIADWESNMEADKLDAVSFTDDVLPRRKESDRDGSNVARLPASIHGVGNRPEPQGRQTQFGFNFTEEEPRQRFSAGKSALQAAINPEDGQALTSARAS
jgi:transcriptional regulator with XRE-family HTH domain